MPLLRPFRCRGCLIPRIERRNAHFASAIPPSADDMALLDFFNRKHAPCRGRSTGLLRNKQITSPEAFEPVAMATMARANYIVRRIINARDEPETRKIVKNIDRLSDLLCGIIDMTELIRHTHPDKAWVDAANNAYDILYEYMNSLNTHIELAAVSPPHSTSCDGTYALSGSRPLYSEPSFQCVAFRSEADSSDIPTRLSEVRRPSPRFPAQEIRPTLVWHHRPWAKLPTGSRET